MSQKASKTEKVIRQPITRSELEHAIANLVKGAADCDQFVGVIVERVTPDASGGNNWVLKGVKYGNADRTICDAALSASVTQQALQFDLSD
jgi:hypothetical protein